ncbi:hypothetical protein CMV16_03170 [Peribacillus simplex]|nr:hypothetical protein CMV16_03170 [Peribacillus simplex]
MIELGSEFWLNDELKAEKVSSIPTWLEVGNDNALLLSGRSAIDFVLKDIMKYRKLSTVYFPSYCCQSMLQPFIDNGIHVEFYDVYNEGKLDFNINVNQDCDVFFAMNYFGFTDGRMDDFIDRFKEKNIIVIEDSTHSLLSDFPCNKNSDYVIASIRKWLPIISGGLASKIQGEFSVKTSEETLHEMVNLRKSAMLDKARYIQGDETVEKANFLQKYSSSNAILLKNYSMYRIDNESLQFLHQTNKKTIVRSRRNNAKVIYNMFNELNEIKPLFPALNDDDCPLFVPVTMNGKIRDLLRIYLIKNNVYYPIHWPKPTIMEKQEISVNIIDNELSLICDQRYSVSDIEYSVQIIKNFFEEQGIDK